MDSYTEDQPKDGERILHCAHVAGATQTGHWFHYVEPVRFTRPNLTTGKADWLLVCGECLVEHEDPSLAVTGDSIWHGDDPIIEREDA